MIAVFKREFQSLFTSPLGYVFCGMFLLVSNFYFLIYNVMSAYSDITSLFSNMLYIMCILIPVLTMRMFSEEMKNKSDQLLLTAPVNLFEIVGGKIMAGVAVFACGLAGTFLYPIITTMYGTPDTWVIVGNYVALFLACSALISMGVFFSSLTENQLISALISFVVFLMLSVIDTLAASISGPFGTILGYMSFNGRFDSGFAAGVFSIADLVYYISVTALFAFLTVRVLEKKRYA